VTTLVLVHGAGHTSRVWRRVRAELRTPSLAVDLPGRHDRPADITRVTVDEAADSIAGDVCASVPTDALVLVGHSVGGIVLPGIAARLGDRVAHLVFVAGLVAAHGARVVDTVRSEHADRMDHHLDELRRAHAGHVFRPDADRSDAQPTIAETRVAMGIDSLNYMTQRVSWDGVDPAIPRTFVRCTRDPIQPPELQARLAENCRASAIVDLESGHTPALDVPDHLAQLLDGIVASTRHRAADPLPEIRLRED
jgi:pimeloyl-ACP methyl ester carboxylesterase